MKSYRISADGFHVDTILHHPALHPSDLQSYAYAWPTDNRCPAAGVSIG